MYMGLYNERYSSANKVRKERDDWLFSTRLGVAQLTGLCVFQVPSDRRG